MAKKEPKCFTDQKAHDFKWVPGAQYIPHTDWEKTNFKARGKFGKYKKITFTEEVLNFESKKVGPNKYETLE